MNKVTVSTKIFFALVILLALLTALSIFLPQGSSIPMTGQTFPAPLPIMALATFFIVLVVYGGLGFIGLKLSSRINISAIWDNKISIKHKIVVPAFIGVIIGIIFIVVDIIWTKVFSIEQLHPDFPFSIAASLSAGIGEEVLFRLFFISFWVWLISNIILKQKHQTTVFWIVTIFSVISFSFSHIPSAMVLGGYGSFNEMPIGLIMELLLLNGLLTIFCAYNFRKYGIISAMVIHFCTDIVWHVIWGAIK